MQINFNPSSFGNYGNYNYYRNFNNVNNANKRVDPNEYAQQYASQNNLTLEEAKTRLKTEYGDPVKPDESNFNNNFNNFSFNNINFNHSGFNTSNLNTNSENTTDEETTDNNKDSVNPFDLNPQQQELFEKGIPIKIIRQGDDAIRKYAQDFDINLPSPEQKLS